MGDGDEKDIHTYTISGIFYDTERERERERREGLRVVTVNGRLMRTEMARSSIQ